MAQTRSCCCLNAANPWSAQLPERAHTHNQEHQRRARTPLSLAPQAGGTSTRPHRWFLSAKAQPGLDQGPDPLDPRPARRPHPPPLQGAPSNTAFTPRGDGNVLAVLLAATTHRPLPRLPGRTPSKTAAAARGPALGPRRQGPPGPVPLSPEPQCARTPPPPPRRRRRAKGPQEHQGRVGASGRHAGKGGDGPL